MLTSYLGLTRMASMGVYMYLWVLFVGIFVQKTNCYESVWLSEKQGGLFVFGDSLFDAGMNNYINTTTDYQANFPPYGQSFFRYPNGRFSDGRIIPDFIAEYAKLPLVFPYMHPDSEKYYTYGVNFASGGSGALVETAQGFVVDLKKQVSYYKNVRNALRKKLGDAEANALVSKSVHLFSVGGNDYGARFVSNYIDLLRYSQQQFVDIVIGNITTAIKEIHSLGGRKFAFVNVPRVGCDPIIRILVKGNKCNEEISEAARQHNKELSRMLLKLQKQLKGFKYSIFDLYYSLSELIKHPSKYGFKEVEVACCGGGAYRGDGSCGGERGIKKYDLCGNVNQYLFFDSAHPTDQANQHFSKLMWTGNTTFNHPYNLKQLFQF